MDAILYFQFAKGMAIFAGIVGVVAGLDLLFGVRLLKAAKGVADKPIDLDKIVIKVASTLREKLDKKAGEIDERIMNTQLRVILGSLFLVLSAVILMLVRIY